MGRPALAFFSPPPLPPLSLSLFPSAPLRIAVSPAAVVTAGVITAGAGAGAGAVATAGIGAVTIGHRVAGLIFVFKHHHIRIAAATRIAFARYGHN